MLKSCARGVVRLQPMFSFLLLVILFGLQSSDLCPFIKIIMVSKTLNIWKSNMCWSQGLFSAIIKKPIGKSYWVFVKGIGVMLQCHHFTTLLGYVHWFPVLIT